MSSINIYVRELNGNTERIVFELRKLRSKNISLWMFREEVIAYDRGRLIREWKDLKFIEENHTIDNSITYFLWDITQNQASMLSCGLKWVISRNEETQFCILTQNNHPFNNLVVFKDAIHKENLPEKFIKAPCFCSMSGIVEYCRENNVFDFSLGDINKFHLVNGIDPIQGARVYEEINSRCLWYLDMLHKTHYEVFDATGKTHLGEADLNGLLDVSKKDNKKHINR